MERLKVSNSQDKCPGCDRFGVSTHLKAAWTNVYRCLECDIYWYWCTNKKHKVDILSMPQGDGI